MTQTEILVGTRKGAWVFADDGARGEWSLEGPMFLGQIVNHFVQDPRDANVRLIAAKTGHLGPTVFRSLDAGGPGPRPGVRPHFRRPAMARPPARSSTASGSSRATPASPASGGRGPRRPACSSARTTGRAGRA